MKVFELFHDWAIKLLGIKNANIPNDLLAKVTATASLPRTSAGERIV